MHTNADIHGVNMPTPSTISVLIKPAGPDCNLRCTYCFYRQKAGLFPESKEHRMKDSTLENLVAQAMEAGQDLAMFSWQGGEPTLMGLDFFRKVVQLQGEHMRPGQIVTNALQTNGILLDRRWAEFLREYNFLVGVSIDGPAGIHDHYRKDANNSGTHARVLQNIRMLIEEGVEVNTLTLVNERNAREPDRVYDFLLNSGVKYFQFIPCVEPGPNSQATFYSVSPESYGDFLCALFDRWMDSPMDVSVRDFDELMNVYNGQPVNSCIFQERCGGYFLIEHTGDVFPCDFFVLPKWKLGNLNEISLGELKSSPKLQEFGDSKTIISDDCKDCEWLRMCYGGCLKHRGVLHLDRSYFCESYKRLFAHSKSVLETLNQG